MKVHIHNAPYLSFYHGHPMYACELMPPGSCLSKRSPSVKSQLEKDDVSLSVSIPGLPGAVLLSQETVSTPVSGLLSRCKFVGGDNAIVTRKFVTN